MPDHFEINRHRLMWLRQSRNHTEEWARELMKVECPHDHGFILCRDNTKAIELWAFCCGLGCGFSLPFNPDKAGMDRIDPHWKSRIIAYVERD
jgi:hypothetical protein